MRSSEDQAGAQGGRGGPGGRHRPGQGSPAPGTVVRTRSSAPLRVVCWSLGPHRWRPRRDQVEGLAVVAPEHAGEAALAGRHPVERSAAFGDPQALGVSGVGHPDRPSA